MAKLKTWPLTLLAALAVLLSGCAESSQEDGGGKKDLDALPDVAVDRGRQDGLSPSGPCTGVVLSTSKSVCLPKKSLFDASKGPKAITSVAPESLPAKVDHRSSYLEKTCSTVHDQGKCGWTVPHAVTGAMEAAYCKQNASELLLSPPHLWHAAAKNVKDCSGEWDILSAFKIAAATYLVSSTVWPYDTNVTTMATNKPPAATLLAKGEVQVKSYGAVKAKDPTNLKTALHKGYDVVYVVPVFQGMGWSKPCSGASWKDGSVDWTPASTSAVRCKPTKKLCKTPDFSTELATCRCETSKDCPTGLHCVSNRCADGWQAVLVTGYDDANGGWFSFKNSWGKEWGDKGYGRLSYQLVKEVGQGGLLVKGLDLKTVCAKQVCVPGSKKCDALGKDVLECTKDGCSYKAYQSCTCGCANGKCTGQVCKPGARRCHSAGKILEECTPDGCGWKTSKTCTCGCSGKACKAPVCTKGQTKCDTVKKWEQQCQTDGCAWKGNRSGGVAIFGREAADTEIPGSFRSSTERDQKTEKSMMHSKKCKMRQR